MVSPVGEGLAKAWRSARRPLWSVVPRADRDRLEDLCLGLVGHALDGRPFAGSHDKERHPGLLRVGTRAAAELARLGTADVETLAATAVLPWYDDMFFGNRSSLLTLPAPTRPAAASGQPGSASVISGPRDWTVAMLTAVAPPQSRSLAVAGSGNRDRYLRHLATLPPQLRAAVVLVHHFAAGTPEVARTTLEPGRPFEAADLTVLGPGLPAGLPVAAPAPRPPSPPVDPVGCTAEALALVRTHAAGPVARAGDDLFSVDALELVYRVRWKGAPEAIPPPPSYPGDGPRSPDLAPGWMVDRVTREVLAVDLSVPLIESWVESHREYPLLPGWRPAARVPVADGFAVELADALPHAARAELADLVAAIDATYRRRLDGGTWPDYLVAWWVARNLLSMLPGAPPDLVAAALLVARGPGAHDALNDGDVPAGHVSAAALAAAARPAPEEMDGPGARRRAARMADAPAAARQLAVAEAHARARVEAGLLGALPSARAAELRELSTLAGQPAPPAS